jgi:hypothetical protein
VYAWKKVKQMVAQKMDNQVPVHLKIATQIAPKRVDDVFGQLEGSALKAAWRISIRKERK